jgi:hypothetical protein
MYEDSWYSFAAAQQPLTEDVGSVPKHHLKESLLKQPTVSTLQPWLLGIILIN